jgi:hypothetical protein
MKTGSFKPRKVERDVYEYFQASRPCKVDREAGIIYGAKVVGFQSKNGGRYSKECLEAAKSMYEGAKCNLNHPHRESPGVDRNIEDRFGIFHNVRIGEDGAYADLHYLKAHPFADRACEAAESMPEIFGFSHNAKTIQVPDGNGGIIHESITRVRSVDLVADPATTSSIFESEDESMNDPHTQGMAGDDAIADEGSLAGDGAVDAGAAAATESDPVDVAIDAILAKYLPAIKDPKTDKATRKSMLSELQKKIDAIIKALADEEEEPAAEEPAADDGGDFGGDFGGDDSEESAKQKGKAAKPDYEQALDVLESAHVHPTSIRVKALLAVPVADRKALAESWPKMGAGNSAKPKSGSVMESFKEGQDKDKSTASVLSKEQLKDDAMLLMAAR